MVNARMVDTDNTGNRDGIVGVCITYSIFHTHCDGMVRWRGYRSDFKFEFKFEVEVRGL
jgi:hypothetical protein